MSAQAGTPHRGRGHRAAADLGIGGAQGRGDGLGVQAASIGLVENQQNGVTREAGHRLATHDRLPLLTQIPWSPDIPLSMDEHVPFDHQVFLPVAQALTDLLFPASEVQGPPTSENSDLLRRAEA